MCLPCYHYLTGTSEIATLINLCISCATTISPHHTTHRLAASEGPVIENVTHVKQTIWHRVPAYQLAVNIVRCDMASIVVARFTFHKAIPTPFSPQIPSLSQLDAIMASCLQGIVVVIIGMSVAPHMWSKVVWLTGEWLYTCMVACSGEQAHKRLLEELWLRSYLRLRDRASNPV